MDELFEKKLSRVKNIDDFTTEIFFGSTVPHESIKSYSFTHYTSPEGFKGIIENKEFFATRIDCLNDYNEHKQIDEIYKNVIKKKIEENDFFKNFEEVTHTDFYGYVYQDKNIIKYKKFNDPEFFVVSFSNDEDSLPMWNYYLKNNKYEGYGLEFYNENCEFNEDPVGYKILDFDINYDNKSKENIISRILDKIKELSIIVDENYIRKSKDIISYSLFLMNDSCKNKAFKHENEHRILIVQDKNNREFEVFNRIKNGVNTPYIKISFKKLNIELSEVKIPPVNNDDQIKILTKKFLEKNGFKAINVTKSNIPVRY